MPCPHSLPNLDAFHPLGVHFVLVLTNPARLWAGAACRALFTR